jgi:hypothetical protein
MNQHRAQPAIRLQGTLWQLDCQATFYPLLKLLRGPAFGKHAQLSEQIV